MRNIILIVFGAALALGMMAACSVPDMPQPNSTAPAQSAHIPADEGDSEPLSFLGQGAPLGDGDENGYYYMSQRADASFNVRYVDYASRSEVVLCNRPRNVPTTMKAVRHGVPTAAVKPEPFP